MSRPNSVTRNDRLSQEMGFVNRRAGAPGDAAAPRTSPSTLEQLDRYCMNLSRRLNAAGWDMRRTLKDDVSLQWNPALVKRYLWGDLQREIFGRRSLAQLSESDVAEVYHLLHSYLMGRTGISEPWPRREVA